MLRRHVPAHLALMIPQHALAHVAFMIPRHAVRHVHLAAAKAHKSLAS